MSKYYGDVFLAGVICIMHWFMFTKVHMGGDILGGIIDFGMGCVMDFQSSYKRDKDKFTGLTFLVLLPYFLCVIDVISLFLTLIKRKARIFRKVTVLGLGAFHLLFTLGFLVAASSVVGGANKQRKKDQVHWPADEPARDYGVSCTRINVYNVIYCIMLLCFKIVFMVSSGIDLAGSGGGDEDDIEMEKTV